MIVLRKNIMFRPKTKNKTLSLSLPSQPLGSISLVHPSSSTHKSLNASTCNSHPPLLASCSTACLFVRNFVPSGEIRPRLPVLLQPSRFLRGISDKICAFPIPVSFTVGSSTILLWSDVSLATFCGLCSPFLFCGISLSSQLTVPVLSDSSGSRGFLLWSLKLSSSVFLLSG